MCGPTPPDGTVVDPWANPTVGAHLHAGEGVCPHPGPILDCPRLTGGPR